MVKSVSPCALYWFTWLRRKEHCRDSSTRALTQVGIALGLLPPLSANNDQEVPEPLLSPPTSLEDDDVIILDSPHPPTQLGLAMVVQKKPLLELPRAISGPENEKSGFGVRVSHMARPVSSQVNTYQMPGGGRRGTSSLWSCYTL